MRGAVAAALVLAAAAAGGAAWFLLLREEPRPPAAVEPPDPEPAPPARKPREVPAPAPLPPAVPPPEPIVEEAEDDDWKAYPDGAKGPVVVGVVTKYGDRDPDCWVALESVDDPARPDPSVVETLENGRFRLTGMVAGKYRVRVKEDETLPTYSAVLITRDGAVTDAGTLRLNRRGYISGVLRDGAGTEVPGEVRLFGRDPASLEARVLESGPSIARQGFQVPSHEAGEFSLAATGDAGFALHRGKTDGSGLAWVDLRLRPWARLEASVPADRPGGPESRAARIVLVAAEVPDLGIPAPGGNRAAPAKFERLPPGKYRVKATWEERASAEWVAKEAEKEVVVAEGETAKVEMTR